MKRGCNISSVNSYGTHFSDYKQIELIVPKKGRTHSMTPLINKGKDFIVNCTHKILINY